ncbi:hypothetical protein C8A01DRAFT_47866 [Parachaetomium inaequale]|uniref:Fungal calcium binding protein domain-containing protein n=1 Tax=Parachaetomium inaequale TaxID=2588326 RepID=A0AAN6SPS0_9PEZI|nr:hypothetical protein C8A01DRAFT_47866 [Parachaetomium inaequale]
MRFTTATITALTLLAPALALPSGETREFRPLMRDMTPRATFNEAEVFAFAAPAGCSILSCIGVIGEAVCIAEAIEDEDWKGIVKCAKVKELCGCAGCFSALGGFLEKYGLC